MAPEAMKAGEGGSERRQHDVAHHGPGRSAERARGFFQAGVEFFHGGHDGEDHARNGEIQVAEEQALRRIGEHPFLAEHEGGDVMSPMSPCRPASKMIMKPTTTPGNASGKVNSATRTLRPGETRALQEQPGDRGDGERRDCGRRREQHGVDQRRAIARLGEDRGVGVKAKRAAGAGDDQPRHRQQKERDHHHHKRQQAETNERLQRHGSWCSGSNRSTMMPYRTSAR